MDDDHTTAGLQRQADDDREFWLQLYRHVNRALADPANNERALRGLLLTLRRAGVEVPEMERDRELVNVA